MSCDYEQGRKDESWSWFSTAIYVAIVLLAYNIGRVVERIDQEKQQTQTVAEKKADLPAPPMTVRAR